MTGLPTFYETSVGRKVFMAVTGALMLLFLIAHLAGNMLIFVGRDTLNAYGAFLKKAPEILWVARIVLAVGLILHVLASVQVTLTSWAARPKGYVIRRHVETNITTRTMIIGGPMILLYVVYHLLMFTFLTTGPGYSQDDIYRNEILAFRQPVISGVYILAMLALGFHLYHGTWSMFQTLGAEWNRARRALGWIVAIVIAGGFVLIPIAVLAGIVGKGM